MLSKIIILGTDVAALLHLLAPLPGPWSTSP